MNTIDKLNNALDSFVKIYLDNPELTNEFKKPLTVLSEAIIEVENLAIHGVSQQRELLIGFTKYISDKTDMWRIPIDEHEVDEFIKTNL